MNNEIKDRIRILRNRFGINQAKFAERISVSRSAVCKMESGENKPSEQTIKLICQEFNVKDKWLRDGIEPMLDESFSEYIDKISSDDKDFIKELIDVYKNLDQDSKDALKLLARKMLNKNKENQATETVAPTNNIVHMDHYKTRHIHYFQKVSAGGGELVVDTLVPEKYEIPDIPEYKKVDYAVKVKGISMEPVYNDGDMLLVHSTHSIEVGAVGIFRIGDMAYVKKLGQNELISLNPTCKNIAMRLGIECQGVVIGKIPK